MRLCYTAGPYRSKDGPWGIVKNIRAAEEVALTLWQRGFAVICPHKNTAMLDGAAPDEVWLKGDLEMVKRCDFLVVCPGWEDSTGTRAEIEYARSFAIPVYFWPQDQGRIMDEQAAA